MKSYDSKRLWARSGNICSFPGCGVELVPEQQASRVIGEEAHIKGEKPTAPRYDPNQSPEQREGYDNRILLCPTHHTVIDADHRSWTVEQLLEMKANHERQLIANRHYPDLIDELSRLVREYELYELPKTRFDPIVPEIVEDPRGLIIIRVDASVEKGIDTHLQVVPGQRILIFARGLISYDNGHHFATPEGILCNEYGIPFTGDPEGRFSPIIWPHEQAYKTDGCTLGRIGSLYGWIGTYSPERAFFVGSKKLIEVSSEGTLYLAVNDAAGTYGDNDGEFRVDIRIMPKGE